MRVGRKVCRERANGCTGSWARQGGRAVDVKQEGLAGKRDPGKDYILKRAQGGGRARDAGVKLQRNIDGRTALTT